jgi:hypothetical protein
MRRSATSRDLADSSWKNDGPSQPDLDGLLLGSWASGRVEARARRAANAVCSRRKRAPGIVNPLCVGSGTASDRRLRRRGGGARLRLPEPPRMSHCQPGRSAARGRGGRLVVPCRRASGASPAARGERNRPCAWAPASPASCGGPAFDQDAVQSPCAAGVQQRSAMCSSICSSALPFSWAFPSWEASSGPRRGPHRGRRVERIDRVLTLVRVVRVEGGRWPRARRSGAAASTPTRGPESTAEMIAPRTRRQLRPRGVISAVDLVTAGSEVLAGWPKKRPDRRAGPPSYLAHELRGNSRGSTRSRRSTRSTSCCVTSRRPTNASTKKSPHEKV